MQRSMIGERLLQHPPHNGRARSIVRRSDFVDARDQVGRQAQRAGDGRVHAKSYSLCASHKQASIRERCSGDQRDCVNASAYRCTWLHTDAHGGTCGTIFRACNAGVREGAGVVLGYDRPRDVRKLIERLRGPLAELGALRPRGAMVALSARPPIPRRPIKLADVAIRTQHLQVRRIKPPIPISR